VLETALDAVVFMHSDGVVAAWNAAAERTFGWSSEEAVGRLMADLIVPVQHREAHCRGLARFNRTGEERVLGRRIEISALHKEGREFPVELSITTAGPDADRLFIGFLRDISARRDVEERIKRQAREAEILFEVTRMAAETDSFDDALASCLKAICVLTGWPLGHALITRSSGSRELVSTSIWYEEVPGLAAALKDATAQLRFTPGVGLPGTILESGEPAWISHADEHPRFVRKGLGLGSAFGFPIKAEGNIIAVLEFFTRSAAEPDPDLLLIVRALGEQVGRVLERKRTEAHQRLLLNELNHRVKNTLAIVQSVASQTLRGEGVREDVQRALESRLAALAGAHDVLTEENWEAASIRQVIERAALGCGADAGRFRIEGPDLRIQPRTAVSVTMALHELCTNAVKYGALSNEDGRVRIRWDVTPSHEETRLRLEWREEGGPSVSAPARRGFGSRMIERGLASEMGGSVQLDFLPTGVVCTVEAALPEDG